MRAQKLEQAGGRCLRCKRTDVPLEVHHILGYKTHPHLWLDPVNLEVLCDRCHMGGHWLEWGINCLAANDPHYQLPRKRRAPHVPEQLDLFTLRPISPSG